MFEVCFKYVQDVVSTYKICIGYTEYVQSMKKNFLPLGTFSYYRLYRQ